MPHVCIHMRTGRSSPEKKALLDAVHASLVENFKIPAQDRFLRVLEYAPEDFEVPPARSGAFVLIEISAFAGRSLEAKRGLYKGIITRLCALGVDPLDAMIILNEPHRDNWGIRGGFPASEVDLGYSVDV